MTCRLCALLLMWICTFAQAVELVGEPQVKILGQEVTLIWTTDVACGTRVTYGTTPDRLDQKVEGPVTARHEAVLKGLQKGTVYHYTLGSARQRLFAGKVELPATATSAAPPGQAAAPVRRSVLEKIRDALAPEQKAAANDIGKTTQTRAPPTRQTWGRMDSLQDHFVRHGGDFQSRNADDYAAQAWLFLQRGRAGELQLKWDDDEGTLRAYDARTRAFAAYNRNGGTKTYFRPNNPAYWQKQPGRPISPAELPF